MTQISSHQHSLAGPPAASTTPRWLIEEQPDTVWTRFIAKYRFGKAILVASGVTGVFVVMFIVLGALGVFKNAEYRGMAGIPSVGSSKYEGDSWGTATEGHFSMGGKGDGTYYGKHSIHNNLGFDFFGLDLDPGVGITACGGSFTAQDSIVALVKKVEGCGNRWVTNMVGVESCGLW
jgi:hypothetical protein